MDRSQSGIRAFTPCTVGNEDDEIRYRLRRYHALRMERYFARAPMADRSMEFLEDKQSGLKWKILRALIIETRPISALKPSNPEITYRIQWKVAICVDNLAAKFFRDCREK